MAANITCTEKAVTQYAGTVPVSKFCWGLFTQIKRDTLCKEGFAGLDLTYLTQDFRHAEHSQPSAIHTESEQHILGGIQQTGQTIQVLHNKEKILIKVRAHYFIPYILGIIVTFRIVDILKSLR